MYAKFTSLSVCMCQWHNDVDVDEDISLSDWINLTPSSNICLTFSKYNNSKQGNVFGHKYCACH